MHELIQGKVRTRFAPSPTGYVHIGSLRTALFSFLFARHYGGKNILRIEDTDQTRLVPGALENLVEILHDMGIEFDEGYFWDSTTNTVKEKGEYGPYLQSNRLDIYKQYSDQLLQQHKAYYCFCTPERLDEVRKEQTALKKPPMYDRHCRTLSNEEARKRLQLLGENDKRPVIRLSTPLEGKTIVHDLVYGDITYDNTVIDDQILIKSDGFPTYHFAVVVDDHLMEITHVLRGEDWMSSTPKHVLLYEAFGWEPTAFVHLPNILNENKTKLSKRQGDVSVEDFLKLGYDREALINFVALLGWNPKTEQEIFSYEELIAQFDVSKINKAGAVFDRIKLDWVNSHYIRQKPPSVLADLLAPFWEKAGLIATSIDGYNLPKLENITVSKGYLEAIAKIEQDRLKKLSEITERTEYFFKQPTYNKELLAWKKSNLVDAKEKLILLSTFLTGLDEAIIEDNTLLHDALMQYIKAQGFDVGSVLWPLRTALTGLAASPSPSEVASVLAIGHGKTEILKRLATAISRIE